MQITQSFEIQRPDSESCKAEAMLSLFIAENCSINTCEHVVEIAKICLLLYKEGGKL